MLQAQSNTLRPSRMAVFLLTCLILLGSAGCSPNAWLNFRTSPAAPIIKNALVLIVKILDFGVSHRPVASLAPEGASAMAAITEAATSSGETLLFLIEFRNDPKLEGVQRLASCNPTDDPRCGDFVDYDLLDVEEFERKPLAKPVIVLGKPYDEIFILRKVHRK